MTDPQLLSLNTALQDTSSAGRVRFHIPGHQGRRLFTSAADEGYALDTTELDGLDDLSDPEGCLADALATAAELYGVAYSFFLTQGATVGIQAGMLALFHPTDTVLVPRNVHRAVVHGMVLADLHPAWIMPTYDADWGTWRGLTLAQLQSTHQANPHAKGLVLPHPTYDGWAADIEAIGAYCRQHNLKLLVDEAHGSLWPLSDRLPRSACELPPDAAADVVVHSLHKSAGAMTPAALAHLPHGSRLDKARFQQCLNVLHTSSPPYPLLANMEACIAYWASGNGQSQLNRVLDAVEDLSFPDELTHCTTPNRDSMAMLLKWPTHAPEDWAVTLETELGISYEALNTQSALYKVGIGAQTKDFQRFQQALAELVTNSSFNHDQTPLVFSPEGLPKPDTILSPREAFFSPRQAINATNAVGHVALQTISRCPPGIPVLIPGERIQPAHVPYLPETVSVRATPCVDAMSD